MPFSLSDCPADLRQSKGILGAAPPDTGKSFAKQSPANDEAVITRCCSCTVTRSQGGIRNDVQLVFFQTVKKLPSHKFRREEKCERKPSGCPFAFDHPPQRQNCKIMIQKLILQFWKQLGKKARRDFFDKLTRRKRSGSRVQKALRFVIPKNEAA